MQTIKKNQLSDLVLQWDSVFELWEEVQAKKTIFLANDHPCKYWAIIRKSNLTFTITTQKAGAVLDVMMVCPVIDSTPTNVEVFLDIQHSLCKVNLYLVALVFTDAKTALDATIHMQSKVQDSACTLLEEMVVLSPQVQLKSLPVLDIYAKNIQASHGAKIYRLDQEKLFYLQSKWLSLKESQQLMLSSYAGKLFDGMPINPNEKQELISDYLTFTL